MSLPRENQGSPLYCVHPDPGQTCHEEAAWFVWYVQTAGLYTYSCHEHLIERLRDVRHSIICITRTPRWRPEE